MIRRTFLLLLATCDFSRTVQEEGQHCGAIILNSTHGDAEVYAKCTTATSVHIHNTNLTSLDNSFPSLHTISQNEDKHAIVISFNENLTWSGQLFPKLESVLVKNESLQLATIAIHDNPKLCVPPDALIRLQQLSAAATSRESTFIQHCHCDMNTLQEMEKESMVTRKTPLSVGRCVVFNGDLTIDKSVPENLKHAMSNIRTIHGTISVQDSTWKEFRLPVLEVIENVSKRPAIFIKDNAYLENVSMPLLRSLLSAGDHVHIYNNPRLRLSDFMRETFQTAVLADPTDHSSSTIHIKTSPCRINATGISKELQHCDSIDGDINISGNSNVDRTNLEYLSSVTKLFGCLTIKGTSLKSLLFLSHLKEVHCKSNQPPILIARNPITSIELAVHIVRSSYDQPVVIRNNKFLCEKFIEKWQKLLLTMRKVNKGNGSIIEHSNNGSHCGSRSSQSPLLLILTALASTMMFVAMVLMTRRYN
ncbi:hypothetical protein V3C99_015793 [Haemonchus contortus]